MINLIFGCTVALLSLILVSCSITDTVDSNGIPIGAATGLSTDIFSREVRLKDGRIVQCVVTAHGAITCDFEHTKVLAEKVQTKP